MTLTPYFTFTTYRNTFFIHASTRCNIFHVTNETILLHSFSPYYIQFMCKDKKVTKRNAKEERGNVY